ncbi:ABC transporter permease [Bacteroidia bacterium]|nr:ABC transporter permease [Bacteroidia bacterium]
MLKYLIQKEFKQIARNSFIPKILIALPLMAILVFPWAANQEITHIQVAVVDKDHSTYSRRLTEKIAASTYFRLTVWTDTYENALSNVEAGKVDIILEFPSDFEKQLLTQNRAKVYIASNAVNTMKGGIGSGYMTSIIRDFADEIRTETLPVTYSHPSLSILNSQLFNPYGDYKIFMIPALLVMLLTIICGFLPALSIVSEKETGTIEQINVTPVKKTTFILSKLIPNWILGFIILTMYMLLAWLVYGLIPAGNLIAIYFIALIYIFVVSGLGLVLSNYSSTVQQAMFMMFFFMIIMILLSGLFTPIASMPDWAQTVTLFNPLRYFVEAMRMIYLKGSHIMDLGKQLLALSLFALFFCGWAVMSYRKTN